MAIYSFFQSTPANGFIYVLSNPAMPGLIKIGYTSRDINERIVELSSSTGVPSNFVFEAVFISPAAAIDEAKVHEMFSTYREGAKEFFRVTPYFAVKKIAKLLTQEPLELSQDLMARWANDVASKERDLHLAEEQRRSVREFRDAKTPHGRQSTGSVDAKEAYRKYGEYESD